MKPIAVIAGDGIGPEVMAEAVKVHHELDRHFDLNLSLVELPYNAEYYLGDGPAFNPVAVRADYAGVLLGALGDARVPDNRHAKEIIGGLRQGLELCVNVRPVRLRDLRYCPLKNVRAVTEVDLVIVRENTEDLYAGVSGTVRSGRPGHLALEVSVHSRWGVERTLREAFALARSRPHGKVTLVDKSNVMADAGTLWRDCLGRVSADFPAVPHEHAYVDAAAMDLLRRPERFDVIVTSNLFGDILSDEAAQLAGGLGVAPSASYDPEDKEFAGLFESVHGTAPDIAGTGVADPIATILSYALMLERLGRADAARALDRAVDRLLAGSVLPADLGGAAGTAEVGDELCCLLKADAKDPDELT